jgi:leucyl/phenylalanyl-tRNA--protein transferase
MAKMPIYQLPEDIVFPSPELSEPNGLLAIGGDLTEKRLLYAYALGIFPWYSEGDPILWWSPDPRLVLIPENLKISRSLRQCIKKNIFHVTVDEAFHDVICNCAHVRRSQGEDTWITQEMIDAYSRLFDQGFAHSIESWYQGELVGGLYGVCLGSAFFGESMFTKKSNASKVAFVSLVELLRKWDFTLIDCQVTTSHLMSFGAHEMSRKKFLKMLRQALQAPTHRGRWTKE